MVWELNFGIPTPHFTCICEEKRVRQEKSVRLKRKERRENSVRLKRKEREKRKALHCIEKTPTIEKG